MKRILTALVIVASGLTFAQVGINAGKEATDPHQLADDAILHVENKANEHKGVLLPSVGLISDTDQTTTSGGTVTTGLMVWNNGTAGLTPAGYYYWNGAKWILTGNVDGGSDNVYSTNGTLSEDRIVNQDNHDMTYTTGSGKFIIDGTSKLNGGSYVHTKELNTETSYTVTDEDYYIAVRTNTSQVTVKIPIAAKENAGRVIIITNANATTVVIQTTDGVQALSGTDAPSIPKNKGMWLISDGSRWFNLINY